MRVLITDFLAESDFEREVLPGVEVDALLSLIGHPPTPTDLVRVVGKRPATVLITWYEMFFDPTTLAALSRAGVVGIVRAGVGFDNIDLMGARAAGITVCNVPDYGTDEVADHAMALLLWCLRCIHAAPPAAVPPWSPCSPRWGSAGSSRGSDRGRSGSVRSSHDRPRCGSSRSGP